MPNPITMFQCNQCHSCYKTFEAAMKCEATPTEPMEHPIGASITFENEETCTGMRYSYSMLSGVILYRYKSLSKENGIRIHKWIYVVSVSEKHMEMEVLMATDNFGSKKLMSPAENKFQPGYAQSLQDVGGYI